MSREGARPEVVLATANPGKRREFEAILGDLGLRLRGLDAFPEVRLPPEGADYAANAAAKARAVAAATGRPAIGDDSGLEVDALGGAPGPLSARFGGPGLDDAGRVRALLEAVRARGAGAPRGARFVCVAALAAPDGRVHLSRGECPGRLLEAPRGEGGFGYDPVFVPDGEARTMAELPAEAKHRLSHRGRALEGLREALRELVASA